MAAEIDLDARREPPEVEPVRPRDEKRGLREVHLPGHGLHPVGVPRAGEQAHRGGVAGEGAIGERVDLGER